VILAALLALCWHFNAKPRHEALSAIPGTLRVLAACVVVFGLGGFGLVRLLLPAPLRRYELLWILPTGACAVGLTMTVLGFAAVPYPVSLAVVLVAGALLAVRAVRTRGWPELAAARLAWPTFLGLVVLVVALVLVLLRQHYLAPVATGSDSHVAAGVAQFLKHSYPTGVNVREPINQMPQTWQSKFPIYYAFAAISSVSGLATWQVLAPLAAVLLAMAAVGMFLVARELFATSAAIAVASMALAGLDRMALHTVLNPYFNQTWGFFALPFTLVLGWLVVQPGLSGRSRAFTLALLALFGLVLVLAYPLAAPIPAVPMLVFLWSARRARIRAGERVFRVRTLYRGWRSLLWLIPVAALLAFPIAGAIDKAVAAAEVLAPGHSLQSWGGDLTGFFAYLHFFSLPNSALGYVLFAVVLVSAAIALAGAPRALAVGLGALMAIGLLLAVYLRHRQYGYYFEFKLLAFIGPVLMLIAAVGAGRLRRWGAVIVAVLAVSTAGSLVTELDNTGSQLPPATIALSGWAEALPAHATVRLDMWPPQQLWAAYMLDARPLCSQTPLLGTDYPHVAYSRKADYIIASIAYGRPRDAIGAPLRVNIGYRLYRENPNVPGPDLCTYRRYDRIYTGIGHTRF